MPKDARVVKSRTGPKSKPIVGASEIFALGSKPQEPELHRKASDGAAGASGSVNKPTPGTPPVSAASTAAGIKIKPKDPRLAGVSIPGHGAAPSGLPGPSMPSILELGRRVDFGSNSTMWEDNAVEVDPLSMVNFVLEADDASDERAEAVLCGAAKQLRTSCKTGKVDPLIGLALMTIAKNEASVFRLDNVQAALGSLLRPPDPSYLPASISPALKATKSCIAVLVANLLMITHADTDAWPEEWVSGYVEDSLGDRTWVDSDECRGFAKNMMTAFGTRQPTPQPNHPDLPGEVEIEIDPERLDAAVLSRFKHCKASVANTVTSIVESQLTRRQPWDAVGRNVVKLMISAAGVPAIRVLAAHRLEQWLANPKLARVAGELLRAVAANLSPGSPGCESDAEVLAHVTRIRPKAKPQLNQYLACIREAVGRGADILPFVLKHVIFNELSQTRNPNNMQIISAVIQTAPDPSVTVITEIFGELLKQDEDYSRALKLLLREIVRALRYDFPFAKFACQLHTGTGTAIFRDLRLAPATKRERIFMAVTEIIALSQVLAISPAVKEAAMFLARGERNKDLTPLVNYQNECGIIQRDYVYWIHTRSFELFQPSSFDYMRCMQRMFWIDTSEQFWTLDNWPPENERNILIRIASEVPILEDALLRIAVVGLSKDVPYKASDALEVVDTLVRRCALMRSEIPPLSVENAKFTDLLFSLTQYWPPDGTPFPDGYNPPVFSVIIPYWKAWFIMLVVTAHNPNPFGAHAYSNYPMLAVLVDMCITNQFTWPPTGAMSRERCEELRVRDIQAAAFEKQRIMEFEYYVAGKPVPEDSSQFVHTLVTLDVRGPARKPPAQVLVQLRTLNAQFKIGNLLCRSRNPDFLLNILERQHPSQALPWLGTLVESCEGAFDMLPIPCLCEFLMSDAAPMVPSASASDASVKAHIATVAAAASRKQQLLFHLRNLIAADRPDESQEDEDEDVVDVERVQTYAENRVKVLDYFFQRLSSERGNVRRQAAAVLVLLLMGDTEEPAKHPAMWLTHGLTSCSFLPAILPQLTKAVRQALQVECDIPVVSAYFRFVSECIVGFKTAKLNLSAFTGLILDLANVIVERNIVTEAALKPKPRRLGDGSVQVEQVVAEDARVTLEAILRVFVQYTRALVEARGRPPSEGLVANEPVVIVRWPGTSKRPELSIHPGILNAVVLLLTYGPPEGGDASGFEELCDFWFDPMCRPRVFQLAPNGMEEEIPPFPDWLALKMLRCDVEMAADAAVRGIYDPSQLTVFFQSFGVPAANFSKLLAAMDAAVEANPAAVDAAIPDRDYFLQLLEIQRERGVQNGWKFEALLRGGDGGKAERMDVSSPPIFSQEKTTVVPRKFKSVELLSMFEINPGIRSEVIQGFIMRLFGCDAVVRLDPDETRAGHASFLKALALDFLYGERTERGPACNVAHSTLTVFEKALSSAAPEERRILLDGFIKQEVAAAALLNVLKMVQDISGPDNVISSMLRVHHLCRLRPTDAVPPSRMFANFPDPNGLLTYLPSLPSVNMNELPAIGRAFSPPSLGVRTIRECPETSSQLFERIKAALNNCPMAETESTLEYFVEDGLIRNDTAALIDAMAALLIEEASAASSSQLVSKMPLLVDLLPIIDPELGSTQRVRDVLFTRRVGDSDESRVRPQAYLLSLHTHQASYHTLAETIRVVLAPKRSLPRGGYDPTAVLDFLTACVFIPKLWQGRPRSLPKRMKPDDMLGLDPQHLGRLCDYVLEEACNGASYDYSLLDRVNLLLRCCRLPDGLHGEDPKRLKLVVERLVAAANATEKRDAAAAKKLLAVIYTKRPLGVASHVPLRIGTYLGSSPEPASTVLSGQSPYDSVVHVLITSMGATTIRGKEFGDRLGHYELSLRRIAAKSPSLVLRHISSIAATLRGRTVATKFNIFRIQHHYRLFELTLDLIADVLAPAVFRPAFAESVSDICQTFGQMLTTFLDEGSDILAPFAAKLAAFIVRYLSADSSRAMAVVVDMESTFAQLNATYSKIRMIDDLVSLARQNSNYVRSMQKKGEEPIKLKQKSEVDVWTPRPDLKSRLEGSHSTPTRLRSLLHDFNRNWNDDVHIIDMLRRCEHMAMTNDFNVSSRSSAGLFMKPALEILLRLAQRRNKTIRLLIWSQIAEIARASPADVMPQVVPVLLKVFSPEMNPCLAESTLRSIPDLVACAPEYAGELLGQCLFRLAMTGSKEAERAIMKSLGMLYLVKGAVVDPSSQSSDRFAEVF